MAGLKGHPKMYLGGAKWTERRLGRIMKRGRKQLFGHFVSDIFLPTAFFNRSLVRFATSFVFIVRRCGRLNVIKK
uniref:Uncharacterized protein n=1 Tax=Anguilla anguilla TaxID=7936 RepID=A0A0E9WQF1_ANGAN